VLPKETGDLLRPYLPHVVDDVLATIAAEVPSYVRPIEGRFGANLRLGVEVALTRFLDLPGTTAPALAADRAVYVRLGAGELVEGRTLTALLTAYRIGARVAYRHFTSLARHAGVSAEQLLPLGEAIFAYVDELSAASADGYATEQSARAGERDRMRRELAGLLLSGRADARRIDEVAASAGWALPAAVAVVAVPPEEAEGLGTSLGAGALVAAHNGRAVAIVPADAGAPNSWRAPLTTALAGRHAVVGPTRTWQQAPESLRLALLADRVAGVERAEQPLWVSDNVVPLLLGGDPELLGELAARRLAPLSAVRPASRQRLADTLLAWLSHRGERGRVARTLHVHPQTVGYRLTQLRALFGADLDDPDVRFELELTLRARHLTWQ
jgi:hypothetical protein